MNVYLFFSLVCFIKWYHRESQFPMYQDLPRTLLQNSLSLHISISNQLCGLEAQRSVGTTGMVASHILSSEKTFLHDHLTLV